LPERFRKQYVVLDKPSSLVMDDIKTAIAAADIAVKEGRKPSTESLVELFRALRKSKV
jgi:hypothetical protein